MTNREIDMALQSIRDIRAKAKELRKGQDEEDKELGEELEEALSSTVTSMFSYTDSVFLMNQTKALRDILQENLSREDYISEIENSEKRRKNAHNTLISNLKVMNLYCDMVGLPAFYSGFPEKYKKDVSELLKPENRSLPDVLETRHAIAKWTWDFCISTTIGIQMGKDLSEYQNLEDVQRDYREGVKGISAFFSSMDEIE